MSTPWIRILALSSLAAFCTLCPNPNVRPAGATPPPGYALVWTDEFNGTALDTMNWGYRQPGQFRREAINVRDAVSVGGGLLTITTYDQAGTHYTGMIQTGEGVPNELEPHGNKYMPRYGYMEASIDFDDSTGMWSSYWLQTPNNLLPGPRDPRDRGSEMDIIEHRVIDQFGTNIRAQAPSALHWLSYSSPVYPNTPDVRHAGGDLHAGIGDLSSGFHTYGLEWTPDFLKFYYDSQLVWTEINSPDQDPPQPTGCAYPPCSPPGSQSPSVFGPVSHANQYILLCSEVIDSSWCGMYPPNGYGSLANSTTKMKVDYVRVYQVIAAPTGLTATAQSLSQINLTWTDNSDNEDGFKVERSTDNVNFSQIGSVAAGVQTYLDTGLNADTRYYYRVRASDGLGYSPYSNKANTVTDVSPPAAVTNLALPDVRRQFVAVSWTAPGDDGTGESVVEYDLRRSTSPITAANFLSATRVTTGNPQVSGHPECRVVSGLTGCTTYYFAIKSRDEAGNWSGISNVPNATTPCQGNILAECTLPDNDGIAPAAVTNLSVSTIGTLAKAVSWTAPGDDGTTGTATEYDLRRSGSPITAANFSSATRVLIPAPQAAGTPECRLVTGLSSCTTYYFALKTRDEWGNWSGISNVPSAATECGTNHFPDCEGGGGAAKQPLPNDEAPRLFSAPRPNPAHGSTSFRILVPSESQGVKLRVGVFDIQGRQVRSLVDRTASPGPAQIEWNLLDDSGHRVASGLYMVRVNLGDTRKTFRLVVVR
jgi:beta-glucanase (GH16 family)